MLLKISDSEDFYRTIVDRLNQGGIVCLPTDTVYGLAADAGNETAVERLSALKSRGQKPFAFFIPKHKLDQYALVVKMKLIDYFLPGPLTVLLKPSGIAALPRTGDRVGIRVPQHPLIAKLINVFPRPLAVTSANRSGAPALTSPFEIVEQLTDVELVVDGGELTGPASTVLDLVTTPATVVRKGKVPILEIDKVQGRRTSLADGEQFNVLFVCTGNTCRSPMAMGIFKTLVDPDRVCVRSAGISTVNGNPAAQFSIDVVREHSGRIEDHLTRELTPELTRWADLILVMEYRHYEHVLQFAPEAVSKVFLLKEYKRNTRYNEVADPIGQDLEAYRRAALDMMPSLRFVARDVMSRFKIT